MIKKENKRVFITLAPETLELLDSLSKRYNKTFSETVKWALFTLAAKRKHNLTIMLRENQVQEEPEIDNSESKELQELFKDR